MFTKYIKKFYYKTFKKPKNKFLTYKYYKSFILNEKGFLPGRIFDCKLFGLKGCIIKRLIAIILLISLIFSNISPNATFSAMDNNIIYPLKEVSKLECRFNKFSELDDDCKMDLPILYTKDYKKYIELNGGYNEFTRLYTVLWASSYKYGWDVGNGGHEGTDIATAEGTPVYSIANGKVIVAKNMLGWGNSVSIEHNIGGKIIVSNYSHLSKIDVLKGDNVVVGDKIGEVGNTGNSHGNHLHFQIDLDTPFHPYYYDYKYCPYSYNEISESSICFNELNKNTIDPLVFLETKGAILDNIKVINKINISNSNNANNINNTNNSINPTLGTDFSIFGKTVYTGYSSTDVKRVQEIFGNLGEYNGPLSGDYNDILEDIISYQLSNNIIKNKNDDGAGWFGPKTRIQAENDYKNYINSGGKDDKYVKYLANKTNSSVENNIVTEKISRENVLTREEIEAREVEEFINKYNIELNFQDISQSVAIGKTNILKLNITEKKGKAFRGNMPSGITFVADFSKVSVFPEKLYNFTDGKRDIIITGLKDGNTTLYVKAGEKVIKTFDIKIYNSGVSIKPETGIIISPSSVVLSDIQTGVAILKDKSNRNLVNLKYDGSFKIAASPGVSLCIKKGNIKDIKKIMNKSCSDFKDEIIFNYNDTVGGFLIFDYKVNTQKPKITLSSVSSNKNLYSKSLSVSNPKGMKVDYEYKTEVLKMLEKGIVDGINKGYFLQERELTQYDAYNWIENTLEKMKKEVIDTNIKKEITKNLALIGEEKNKQSKFNSLSRKDLLDLSDKYLIFTDLNSISRKYKDLESKDNQKANYVFDSKTTWKDQFGENYFRPDVKITRGEGAFFLSKVIEKNEKSYLTVR